MALPLEDYALIADDETAALVGCDERRRLVGNFPQALTHVSLVDTARNLSRAGGLAHHRSSPSPSST